MEDRIGVPILFEVDLERVNLAYQKMGLSESLYKPLNDEQIDYLKRKKLTVLQGRLLYLFKQMLDDELALRDEESRLNSGERILIAGLNFKSKMLKYEEIAEAVFAKWAGRIGISHLYNLSLQQENDIHSRNHELYVCIDAYDDFDEEISPGVIAPIAQEALHNTSGKTIYERFLAVLKSLQ